MRKLLPIFAVIFSFTNLTPVFSQQTKTADQIEKELKATRAAEQAKKNNDLRRVHPPGDSVRPDSKRLETNIKLPTWNPPRKTTPPRVRRP